MVGRLWRDASSRLTYEWVGVEGVDYPALCRAIVDAFGLIFKGELIVCLDEMFQEFSRETQSVGIEWDIWTGFTVVAKSPESEPLIIEISEWLNSRHVADRVKVLANRQ